MRKNHWFILFVLSFTLVGCGLFSSPSTPELTIEVAGAGLGTVTSSPEGINCGTACTLASSEEIVLTATPASGSVFSKWDGCETATGDTCTVTLSQDETITATFDKTAAGQYSGKIIFFDSEFGFGNGLLADMNLEAKDNGYTGTIIPLADIGLPTIPVTCGAIASDDTLTCNLTIAEAGATETLELKVQLSGTTKFSGSSLVDGIIADQIAFEFTTDSYQPEQTDIDPNATKPSVEGTYKGQLEIGMDTEIPNTFASFPTELAIRLEDGKHTSTLTILVPGTDNNQDTGTCGELDDQNILICELDVQGGIFKFTGELTDTLYSGKFEGIPPTDFESEVLNGSFSFNRQ